MDLFDMANDLFVSAGPLIYHAPTLGADSQHSLSPLIFLFTS